MAPTIKLAVLIGVLASSALASPAPLETTDLEARATTTFIPWGYTYYTVTYEKTRSIIVEAFKFGSRFEASCSQVRTAVYSTLRSEAERPAIAGLSRRRIPISAQLRG